MRSQQVTPLPTTGAAMSSRSQQVATLPARGDVMSFRSRRSATLPACETPVRQWLLFRNFRNGQGARLTKASAAEKWLFNAPLNLAILKLCHNAKGHANAKVKGRPYGHAKHRAHRRACALPLPRRADSALLDVSFVAYDTTFPFPKQAGIFFWSFTVLRLRAPMPRLMRAVSPLTIPQPTTKKLSVPRLLGYTTR